MKESIKDGTDSCRISYAGLSGLDSRLGNGEPLHGFEQRSHLVVGGGSFRKGGSWETGCQDGVVGDDEA